MANINTDMVKITKKLTPARNNALLQDGGFGVEFGIWFAALITLALNGDHIATSFNLGDGYQEQLYGDIASLFFRDFFATHEISTDLSNIENYNDIAQYLVSENWVSSDPDAA